MTSSEPLRVEVSFCAKCVTASKLLDVFVLFTSNSGKVPIVVYFFFEVFV